jgi:hypothetical protein
MDGSLQEAPMGRFLIITLALFTSVEASANPVLSEMLRASAVDGPHVRLDYLADKARSNAQAPVLGCHGSYCSPWQADKDTSADTGSGVRDLFAMHMCDCYVPTGTELKYAPVDKPTYSMATVKVTSYQGDPVPGGLCQVECAPGAGKADAALPEGTTDPKTEGAGGGSCTFAPTGRQATLPLLAFVAAIIVFWRRRS